MKKILLTGATGVMGRATLAELLNNKEEQDYNIRVLARSSSTNRKKLSDAIQRGVEVVWGDLTSAEDVARAVDGIDIILHLGGLVSPVADMYPSKTIDVNIGGLGNIIRAVKEEEKKGHIPALVYIGSVSQYGDRSIPNHWGKAGDQLHVAAYDAYAYSKIMAERELVESGITRWVSLRQTGIFYPGLLKKADDPIAFHVPIRGVLEWVTDEDSGRLMERICRDNVPEDFWNGFYNIGGGKAFRLTNYEFEKMVLEAMNCPQPENVFDARWFATKNFHGMWFTDSDRLNEIFGFRSGETPTQYLNRKKRVLPWYFRLAPLAPASVIKWGMKKVAEKSPLGPLSWRKNGDTGRIEAFFGGEEEWDNIPNWEGIDLTAPDKEVPSATAPLIKIEYDEIDLQRIAAERGGEYLGGNKWICKEGHKFSGSPKLIAEGGHWCDECLRKEARLDEVLEKI